MTTYLKGEDQMPRRGGAAKAYRAMTKTYGAKKGRQIFYATANKHTRAGGAKPTLRAGGTVPVQCIGASGQPEARTAT